jgi:hypothetical protein
MGYDYDSEKGVSSALVILGVLILIGGGLFLAPRIAKLNLPFFPKPSAVETQEGSVTPSEAPKADSKAVEGAQATPSTQPTTESRQPTTSPTPTPTITPSPTATPSPTPLPNPKEGITGEIVVTYSLSYTITDATVYMCEENGKAIANQKCVRIPLVSSVDGANTVWHLYDSVPYSRYQFFIWTDANGSRLDPSKSYMIRNAEILLSNGTWYGSKEMWPSAKPGSIVTFHIENLPSN